MSTVKITSSTAATLAEKAAIALAEARMREVKKHVEAELARRNKPGFWFKLFRGNKPWTQEELEAEYEAAEYNFDNPIWMIEYGYQKMEKLAARVEIAASLGDVTLDIEDAAALQNWAE